MKIIDTLRDGFALFGVAFSSTGPFWVSDAGTGVTTIYDSTGAPFPVAGHTVIDIAAEPGQTGLSTPTGQVFNSTADGFQITAGGSTAKSAFIFVTTQGTISGWAPTVAGGDTSVIDNSTALPRLNCCQEGACCLI